MASKIIPEARVQRLNEAPARRDADRVVYWMQQAQRAEDNHALEFAVQCANDLELPLLVVFGLTDAYPEANLRHYTFLLEGLRDVAGGLDRRNIGFLVQRGAPDAVALAHAERAARLVVDRGYLRHQVQWRRSVAEGAPCRVDQVETDVVVPIEVVSDKAEHAARTIRPKIHAQLDAFLVDLTTTPLERDGTDLADRAATETADRFERLAVADAEAGELAGRLDIDTSVPAVSALYSGGTTQAKRVLREFLDTKFMGYEAHRNQPQTDYVSHMSKYLHFGHVSPIYVARRALETGAPQTEKESFLEELIVRRELAVNFVAFTPDYDAWSCLPAWARASLIEHADDPREYVYDEAELVAARTHDPYWNAAMREMVHTGYMHNYMRMYWGKKILEWTADPQHAFERTLRLNNRYFLDGRDPNSYAGVAWCYGIHDRGWTERPIFGKTRYMNANGLRRKADPEAYVAKVDRVVEELRTAGETATGEGGA